MVGQILELIIFAGIAFVIINKLISALGTTSKDDSARSRGFFGEGDNNLKDVTYTAKPLDILKPRFFKSVNKIDLKNLVLPENKEAVEKGLQEVMSRIPSFNIERFVNGACGAFRMIIESALKNEEQQLEELVDKRYIDHFKTIITNYGNLTRNADKLLAHVSEIYMFGNNIFIKVLFSGNNIASKIKDLHEEWTFSKSTLSSDPAWFLTNIDRSS